MKKIESYENGYFSCKVITSLIRSFLQQSSQHLISVNEANLINGLLKKKTSKALSELMHLSEKLAQLNWERNQSFNSQGSTTKRPGYLSPLMVMFIKGWIPYTLSSEKIDQMQNQLRILSGLYGLLRPLDLIQPYRLEMGTNFSNRHSIKTSMTFGKIKPPNNLI